MGDTSSLMLFHWHFFDLRPLNLGDKDARIYKKISDTAYTHGLSFIPVRRAIPFTNEDRIAREVQATLEILKDQRITAGISCQGEHFDEAIKKTRIILAADGSCIVAHIEPKDEKAVCLYLRHVWKDRQFNVVTSLSHIYSGKRELRIALPSEFSIDDTAHLVKRLLVIDGRRFAKFLQLHFNLSKQSSNT